MPIVLPRTIYHDLSAPEALEAVIEERGVRRVFVVSDEVIASHSLFKSILSALEKNGVEYAVFDQVEPEPSIDTAKRIAAKLSSFNPEAVVAIGGGSVIDAAKAALVLYENPGIDLKTISPFQRISVGSKAFLIAVPTTSGTGSDASFGIVLTEEDNGRKRKLALGNYALVPQVTILDPGFTLTMPPSLTKYTALDALAHALEAYVAVMSNPFSDALAEKVAEIVFTSLPRVLSEPENREERAKLHLAATMAGIAFTNAGLGLAHALAHALGPLLGLHHGLAVSLVLPHVVKFNSERSETARRKYENMQKCIEASTGFTGPLQDQLLTLYKWIDAQYKISQLDKPPTRDEWERLIPVIAERALEDPELAFNPASIDLDDLKKLLAELY